MISPRPIKMVLMIYTFAAEDKFFIICSLSLKLVDQALVFLRA